MEALTAVSAACLTLFDMLESIDKTMEIGAIRPPPQGGRPIGQLAGSMIAFDEALRLLREAAHPLVSEPVPIAKAAGRVLAEAVTARVDSPPADCSAMDGYAVREVDVPGALRVVGESFAGSGFVPTVEPGCCVRIFTGAPVPADADRVFVQEAVERQGDLALIPVAVGEARHIRRRGSDFSVGDELLGAGDLLTPRALVAAAAADVAEVEAWRRPTVYVLATGDELAAPGDAHNRPGAIPESVSYGVAALAEQWGGTALGASRLSDDLDLMGRAAGEALAHADLVVVTGGASVGERDFAKAMFADHGLEIVFSKVAIKPGKPVWLGRAGGRLVLGLPGNPTSAMVTARLFLAPLVARLFGRCGAHEWVKVPLAEPLPACGARETFARARRAATGAVPIGNQDSSAQRALVEADLLLRMRPNDPPRKAGEVVEALAF